MSRSIEQITFGVGGPDAERGIRTGLLPVMHVDTGQRWFEDLRVWTVGYQATTTQRARLQMEVAVEAFELIRRERLRRVCITLSFGTLERCTDEIADLFERESLLAHRVMVLLRGDFARVRSPYRLRVLVEFLREHNVRIGFLLPSGRLSMEMQVLEALKPEFVMASAPISNRVEYWQDFVSEASSFGITPRRLVITGIDSEARFELARTAGVRLVQCLNWLPSIAKVRSARAKRRAERSGELLRRTLVPETAKPAPAPAPAAAVKSLASAISLPL
jgi:hypothetical protein